MLSSVFWFVLTGGVGGVVVPWWLTGWQVRQPYPYGSFVRVLGAVLIAVARLSPSQAPYRGHVPTAGCQWTVMRTCASPAPTTPAVPSALATMRWTPALDTERSDTVAMHPVVAVHPLSVSLQLIRH